MITFKTITWKNFLSTGNHPTTVSLDSDSTTLIIGSNGAGKSTILDALTFSLYGKSFRKINKGQLINTTNEKNCLVDIVFTCNSVEWRVERGIKPNIFKIYRDGKELDQSASAIDQQKWLEQNVLKMNYKSFTQIVILGSSSFVPFMQLPTNSRREVVEDLLDIKIFSSMNEIVKSRTRVVRDEVRTLELKKESLKDKVDMQRDFIKQIEEQSKGDVDRKNNAVTNLMEEISGYVKKNDDLDIETKQVQLQLTEYNNASKRLKEFLAFEGKLTMKIGNCLKDHQFFEKNTVCPTCSQDIEERFRLNRISDIKNKEEELSEGYQKLQDAIQKEQEKESQFKQLSGDLSKLLNGISNNNSQINGCQRQISRLEQEIQTITSQIANRNSEHEKLEEFRTSLQDTFENISEKKEKITYLDFTYNLLKDGGVKSQIIKKYLPIINQQANKYLQMMDFYINFKLDEEFTETIESPIHEDFSYASFSEGEKMRIDLALLFTWREVARMKNSVNTNLLIMDEVFDSSLDGFGTEEFLKIIRFVIKDANIFVISHKEGLEDKFDNVVKFEKQGNFSRIEP
tara:strand:+ start:688 stop:2400 length:1713 start_codon:yes stop_codon:yes gene_type:complete